MFFANKNILTIFILLFIYLLPRAGFLTTKIGYRFPLPIGYIFIFFLSMKWFSIRFFEKPKPKKDNPIEKPFSLYILIAMFAIVTGLMNGGIVSTMLLEVLFYFVAFFIFFMVLDIFEDKNCAKIFMNGILICGFLVSLYGVLLLIYGHRLLINYITYNSSSYYALASQFIIAKRTISSYGDPNALGAQLMVFCGIFAGLLLFGRCSLFRKTFLLTGFILTIICVYFVSSRASLFGLFTILIIFSLIRLKRMEFFIPLLITGYIMLIEPIRRYYEHRIFTTGMQSDLRTTYIQTFFDLLSRYPLGIGFGNAIGENYAIIPALNIWYGYNSFYLQIFSKVGLQGLAVFSIMLYFIIRYLIREYQHIEDPNIRYFVFGGACGLIAQQFNFLTNNIYQVPGGMLNFWIMCGMLTAIVNLYKTKRDNSHIEELKSE